MVILLFVLLLIGIPAHGVLDTTDPSYNSVKHDIGNLCVSTLQNSLKLYAKEFKGLICSAKTEDAEKAACQKRPDDEVMDDFIAQLCGMVFDQFATLLQGSNEAVKSCVDDADEQGKVGDDKKAHVTHCILEKVKKHTAGKK